MRRPLVLIVWVLAVRIAAAQGPLPVPPPAPGDDPIEPGDAPVELQLAPTQVDAATCFPLDLTPGALLHLPVTDEFALATPIPWTEFAVEGRLVDSPDTVRTLLAPTLELYRTSLSPATLPDLAVVTGRFGYQLVGHHTEDVANGTRLVLSLAPLPLVRRVAVDMDQSILDRLLRDEVHRRMSIRAGSYLPWDPIRRGCALLAERLRIEEFLFDEGYYDARATIVPVMDVASASLRVVVDLGGKYTLGRVTIGCPSGTERRGKSCVDSVSGMPYVTALTEDEIRAELKPPKNCLFVSLGCIGTAPFTRTWFLQRLQVLKQRFQQRGYPSVRIVTSDPRLGVSRRRKEVDVVITIDQRRNIDVSFDGHDPDVVTDEQLRQQLTFNEAGSADDVEIAESASALTTYLQSRGYFDVRVTWTRDRIDTEPRPNTRDVGVHLDRIVFFISMGTRRRVASVEFVGNTVIATDDLRDLVATKTANVGSTLFGTVVAATSSELIGDQDRIKEAYRRLGYQNARVWPSASPVRAGLDDPALTAALLGVDAGNALFVRFTIEEGEPTLLSRIVISGPDNRPVDDAFCAELLGELATRLGDRDVAARADRDRCAATVRALPFRYDAVAATRDQLREYLFKTGRARSAITYEARPLGPLRIEARYTVDRTERLRLGKVVVRGNFRTKKSVIYRELGFKEGQLLTTDALAQGARRLRNTGLFDAVNIDMPELDCDPQQRSCGSRVINAVVRVEERFDHRLGIQFEVGGSYVNGLFGTLRFTQRNIAGYGVSFTLSGTGGTRLNELEGQLRFPQWLLKRYLPKELPITATLGGLTREQDTDRFGRLITRQLTLDLPIIDSRPRTDEHVARVLRGGPFYAFRQRIRNVDALRPIGADADESRVAVSRRTGAFGINFDWEQRVDRNGQLQPLAPEAGHLLQLSIQWAEPAWFSQNRFLKFSGWLSKFWPVGNTVVVRADLRYDHGIPFGEAMLPDVERFFAGGDNSVRGYGDDRLHTEIIQVGLPPFDNVSQIRVIPAGGNIRVLGSLDGQVRIWRVLAGAMFADAGLIANRWSTVQIDRMSVVPDIPALRPSVGMGLRALTPFGIAGLEYAVPLRPKLGDDPRGRIHFYFAARAQF